jgi:hypothetical protein
MSSVENTHIVATESGPINDEQGKMYDALYEQFARKLEGIVCRPNNKGVHSSENGRQLAYYRRG